MAKLGHTALGTWSGGRFMHFGAPLDDERLAALLRPDERIHTVITADAYGAGEADALLGAARAGGVWRLRADGDRAVARARRRRPLRPPAAAQPGPDRLHEPGRLGGAAGRP